jgi:hypothetical protein
MARRLTQWLSSKQKQKWYQRGLVLILLISLGACLVLFIASLVQLAPILVTDWQGAHGHYPTGHLTYTVPEQWKTNTFTGLRVPNSTRWWDVFEDEVTAISPSYAECFSEDGCAPTVPNGARIDLESAPGEAYPTLEAWYQHWAEITDRYYGLGTVLPLADYTAVPLGGQTALCASNQEGSQLIPPYPPAGPHFNATFPGYSPPFGNKAVIMCFMLWHGRIYHVETAVVLHTPTQDSDLQGAVNMIDSLRCT